jgi:PfaD family protein
MAGAGMLGAFGAAGLSVDRVRAAIERIQANVGDGAYAINLIHSPNERDLEEALVDLFIERGVHLVEASAFLQLTPAVVRYRLHGIHRDADGKVVTPNRIIAKVSREELAEKFWSPAPEKIVQQLLERGAITQEQVELASEVPIAQDITAEADSGGHTDHRPAIALLPTLAALRDTLQERFQYQTKLRVGLAGGISTPASTAAAFAMGAGYIVTGSVNQACVEAGTSDLVREMLAETRQADVTRAPAADMFEMGVTVQVLKRGTMFAMRGGKLYELYRAYDSLEAIPKADREKLEKTVFRQSLDSVWDETRQFFAERDPRQIERAEKNPKHRMALVFRWYLGQSSNWANRGVADRAVDYQVWCGPAMGAFNEWAKGSALERVEERRVATVARNLLYGAVVLQRVQTLRAQTIALSNAAARVAPKTDDELEPYFVTRASAPVAQT